MGTVVNLNVHLICTTLLYSAMHRVGCKTNQSPKTEALNNLKFFSFKMTTGMR